MGVCSASKEIFRDVFKYEVFRDKMSLYLHFIFK